MLVTPQLSQEIDTMLPKAQAQLTQAAAEITAATKTLPNAREFTEIKLSAGDINLLIRKEKGIVRRFY